MPEKTASPLLKVSNFQVQFKTRLGMVRAVDGISYHVDREETVAIVGESGSGKSVSQLSYLGLIPSPPMRITGREVWFDGQNLLPGNPSTLRKIRGNDIAVIFQEPMTSLNPYMRIGSQLIEPLRIHKKMGKKEALYRADEALAAVQISSRAEALRAYPHEFSGGMRQRVMIAMALTTRPKLLIADEPTTALDVTVQAQILKLLKEIQAQFQMSIVLITHDLGIVAGIADRILVLYGGKILEEGPIDAVFAKPQNPYTLGLLKSTPQLNTPKGGLFPIPGAPGLQLGEAGCPFYERCPYHLEICARIFPPAREFSSGHRSYCHLEKIP